MSTSRAQTEHGLLAGLLALIAAAAAAVAMTAENRTAITSSPPPAPIVATAAAPVGDGPRGGGRVVGARPDGGAGHPRSEAGAGR